MPASRNAHARCYCIVSQSVGQLLLVAHLSLLAYTSVSVPDSILKVALLPITHSYRHTLCNCLQQMCTEQLLSSSCAHH